MTLEDKMKRNIKQIEDAGICPKRWFLRGGINECVELGDVFKQAEWDIVKFGKVLDSTKEMFYDEIPDVLNEIMYAVIQFDLDKDKIARIQPEKVDRGYERGLK